MDYKAVNRPTSHPVRTETYEGRMVEVANVTHPVLGTLVLLRAPIGELSDSPAAIGRRPLGEERIREIHDLPGPFDRQLLLGLADHLVAHRRRILELEALFIDGEMESAEEPRDGK